MPDLEVVSALMQVAWLVGVFTIHHYSRLYGRFAPVSGGGVVRKECSGRVRSRNPFNFLWTWVCGDSTIRIDVLDAVSAAVGPGGGEGAATREVVDAHGEACLEAIVGTLASCRDPIVLSFG